MWSKICMLFMSLVSYNMLLLLRAIGLIGLGYVIKITFFSNSHGNVYLKEAGWLTSLPKLLS